MLSVGYSEKFKWFNLDYYFDASFFELLKLINHICWPILHTVIRRGETRVNFISHE